MRSRSIVALATAAVLAAAPGVAVAAASPGAATTAPAAAPQGSFTLSGAQAVAFRLPADVVQVSRQVRPDGATATRYQQVVDGAKVVGAQLTVLRSADGVPTAVVGAYFDGVRAKTTRVVGAARAEQVAVARDGARGRVVTDLRLVPSTGRLVLQVVNTRAAARTLTWVDAATGAVTKRVDVLTEGQGVRVKGATKTLDTSGTAGAYQLRTADGRQETYDAGQKTVRGTLMTDPDDIWNTKRARFASPDQRPGVDAHYYAGVVDDFYGDVYGRNSIDDKGMKIISTVHYDRGYCNAFWNGVQMTYGDGDGTTACLPLSGGLDVVGHELTHGVTEFTSGLIYDNESGALNEAFSDMMGNTIEFWAAARGADPAGKPDWRIGEDVILDTAGFRNMGDPQEFGDPDHYSEKYTGTADGGGVHTNSGIPNHAYYLAVNGGRNAGCGTSVSGHTHTADCDVTVPALGLAAAERVFYDGFTALPEYANFCDARNSTVAVAGRKSAAAVAAAWDAVGVTAGCTVASPPPPPCPAVTTVSGPFESEHPYRNDQNCSWTYTGTPGFAFHFSVLDVEKDYDYVYVKDGNGTVLATYTGLSRRAVTSPCIPTATGTVQLVTDPGVTAQGFVVDAITDCTVR